MRQAFVSLLMAVFGAVFVGCSSLPRGNVSEHTWFHVWGEKRIVASECAVQKLLSMPQSGDLELLLSDGGVVCRSDRPIRKRVGLHFLVTLWVNGKSVHAESPEANSFNVRGIVGDRSDEIRLQIPFRQLLATLRKGDRLAAMALYSEIALPSISDDGGYAKERGQEEWIAVSNRLDWVWK